MSLAPKHRRFVAEYLKDQNGTQAAIRAGYSAKTANEQAAQLLAKLSIRAAVDAELAKIQEDAGLTQERIIKALLAIAEADPRKLFHTDGTMKKIHEMPDELASTISSIESDDANANVKKVRFWDKTRALEMLGKHLKMFVDRQEQSGPNGTPLHPKAPPIDFSGLTTPELKRLAGLSDAVGN